MNPTSRGTAPIFLVVASAAALGCGAGQASPGNDGGPPGNDGGSHLSPADQAFIADFCAAVAPCCAPNGFTASAATCKTTIAKVGMSRDSQVRSACLDELHQKSTTAACMPDLADLADPCSRLFNEPGGSTMVGESCTRTADCAGSPGTVTTCSLGYCVAYAPGALGDTPCLGNQLSDGIIIAAPLLDGATSITSRGYICQKRAGLFCDPYDYHCKTVQATGACVAHDGCSSRWCSGIDEGGTGTCMPLPGLGEDCGLNCAGDTTCDSTTAVCVPKLAAGSACTADVQCSGSCAGSDLCSGTCVNAACVPTTGAGTLVLGVWCGVTMVSG
jgi:hypothetical protein